VTSSSSADQEDEGFEATSDTAEHTRLSWTKSGREIWVAAAYTMLRANGPYVPSAKLMMDGVLWMAWGYDGIGNKGLLSISLHISSCRSDLPLWRLHLCVASMSTYLD
jgi:hypothetical protein